MKKITLLFFVLGTVNLFAQVPTYVPASGLVSWWGFTGNALDESPNGNNLTASATSPVLTTDRFGNVNSAYLFNGTSSYFTKTALSYSFTQAGSFSVSIWIKRDVSTAGVAIMSGSSASNNFIWNIQNNTTQTMYGTNKQNSSWVWIYGANYALNQWEHFVGVYSNGTMTFYKNGVYSSTATNAYSASSTSLPIWIGRGSGGSYLNASIDDVGIWDRALTQAEITQLYSGTMSVNSFQRQKVVMYPNPCSDTLFISFEENQTPRAISIYDNLGREVLKRSFEDKQESIDVSELSDGIYFLKSDLDSNLMKFIKK